MPFLREINPASGIRAGIWEITETAGELLANIRLSSSDLKLYETFRHELRKKQWLAYRALLKHMLAPLSTGILYDIHGKPCLDSGSHHISVSHAGDFAAVAYSEHVPVGIDIERIKVRVERVKERFLQESELGSLSREDHLEQLHVLWGGKEALYKLHGKPEVDFRNDIYIHPFDYFCKTVQSCSATITINNHRQEYSLFFEKIADYMLVVAY